VREAKVWTTRRSFNVGQLWRSQDWQHSGKTLRKFIHSALFSLSVFTEPLQFASDITLVAEDLALNDGTQILATTEGHAKAGAINLNIGKMTGNIERCSSGGGGCGGVRGRVSISSSQLASSSGSVGSVNIVAEDGASPVPGEVLLRNVDISATSKGFGSDRGRIEILGQQKVALTGTTLSVNENAQIRGGGFSRTPTGLIRVRAGDLQISGGGITTQGTTSFRDPGAILLEVGALTTKKGSQAIEVDGRFTDRVQISSRGVGEPEVTTGSNINAAGFIAIHAEDGQSLVPNGITLSDTDISTSTTGSGFLSHISISGKKVELIDSTISGNVKSANIVGGNRASITVTADELALKGGGIKAETTGDAPAGEISLRVGALRTGRGSQAIDVGDKLTDRVQISTRSVGNTTRGSAGNIEIVGRESGPRSPVPVEGEFRLAQTDISTTTEGTGTGGSILLNGSNLVKLEDATISGNVHNAPNLENIEGASIELTAAALQMTGGEITAQTAGSRNAGDIVLRVGQMTTQDGTIISSSSTNHADTSGAARSITIQGVNNNKANNLVFDNTTFSTTIAGGTAKTLPGDITMTADDIRLFNGTSILADTSGRGPAGNITISSSSSTSLNNATISSSSTSHDSLGGNAGSVEINSAGPFTSTNSKISTEAITGKGGSIQILGGSSMALDATIVTAEVTGGTEPGGDITIKAGTPNRENFRVGHEQLLLGNGTTVTAKSLGLGNAGNIDLEAGDILRLQNATITTEATQASGGDIKLTADFLIGLLDSQLEASVQGDATTQGGNINIDPEFVFIQNSHFLARAAAGLGGNITIISGTFLIDGLSTFDVSSQFGVSGTITIDSPIQNLSGTIAPLPEAIVEVAGLYSAMCAGQTGGAFSSFTVQGRDRIPLEPGELLPTPLPLASLAASHLPLSGRPILPMAQRLSLPNLEGSLFSDHLRTLYKEGCHS
jgi:large exoprotein involved in heme utilization and adhesion